MILSVIFTAVTAILLAKNRLDLPVDLSGYTKYIWFFIVSADCAAAFFTAFFSVPRIIEKFNIGVLVNGRRPTIVLGTVVALCVAFGSFTAVHLKSAFYVILIYDLFVFYVLTLAVYSVMLVIEYHRE